MDLKDRVRKNEAVICIVGVGFVGLPLSLEFAKAGFKVIGFDVDEEKIKNLKSGTDPTKEIGTEELRRILNKHDLDFTDSPDVIKESDFVIISVPTPIDESRRPVLKYIEKASQTVGKFLKKGSVVVLESSVYPGVTEEIVKPIIEKESGLKCGVDFQIGYSPERINTGDKEHDLVSVVKVISGGSDETKELLAELYKKIIKAGVYKAKDIKTAEAAKIIENIQRDLNIALVNELAIIFEKMNIDVNEVLKAAETKWNFHSYRPGLVGGHCIPVDPYYLVYKAKSLGYNPKIILSGREINEFMPVHVANLVVENLKKKNKVPEKSTVLLLGLTFKKNVGDIRNCPSKTIINELKKHKIKIMGYEPLMPSSVLSKEFGIEIIKNLEGLEDRKIDCIVLVTEHNIFKNIDTDKLRNIANYKPILIDVKGFFDRSSVKKAGFEYVRL
ncbi:MAG: nucleotide sugar dehydrogenase [Candidatus Aenigmatarchaeota archaeon]|nr:MAG: nucleotide sugar dehydrogenase [Candidatus Aenigmarchaeota archaeon]